MRSGSEPGVAVVGDAGPRRLSGGGHSWNQNLEPHGADVQVVARAIEQFGEPSGIRTLDPLIKSQVLYQLS